jgi:hypothetical protein
MLKGVATLALISVVTVSTAQAQGLELGLGGGVTIPTNNNFKTFAKTGWNGQVSLGWVGQNLPVGFEVDGNFGKNKDKGTGVTTSEQLAYGTANVVYKFKTSDASMFRPYVIGGVGGYNLKQTGTGAVTGSTTKFGVNGGAGFDVTSKSNVGFFVEGRFHNIFISNANINFVNVDAGVRFKLGSH